MTVLDSSQPIPKEIVDGINERIDASYSLATSPQQRADALLLKATSEGLFSENGELISYDTLNARFAAEQLFGNEKTLEPIMGLFATEALGRDIEFASQPFQPFLQESPEIPGTSGLQKQITAEPEKSTASKIFGIFSK